MGLGWIYAVHDESGAVVYVGQTIETPAARYRGHLRDALRGCHLPFHRWLLARINDGDVPRVSTLERAPVLDLNECERKWIANVGEAPGSVLLNVAVRSEAPQSAPARKARVVPVGRVVRKLMLGLSVLFDMAEHRELRRAAHPRGRAPRRAG